MVEDRTRFSVAWVDHCRAEFDERFSARHWPREYAWLVERLASQSSAAGPATGR